MRALEPRDRTRGHRRRTHGGGRLALDADDQRLGLLGPIDALAQDSAAARDRPAARRAAAHGASFDLIVLVDFGAFNLRIAKARACSDTRTPILYYFPPGAWLDNAAQARRSRARCDALTAFAHQRDFYRSLGLPIAWFGHPLASLMAPRPPRPAPPPTAGSVALLPGSREASSRAIRRALLALSCSCATRRPQLTRCSSAAHREPRRAGSRARCGSRRRAGRDRPGARAALERADAASVASGTAVLEAALLEVPTVALYILGRRAGHVRAARLLGRFVTLPNLLLGACRSPSSYRTRRRPRRWPPRSKRSCAIRRAARRLAGLRAALGPPGRARALRGVRRSDSSEALSLRIYHTSDLHDRRGISRGVCARCASRRPAALRLRRFAARQANGLLRSRTDRRRSRRQPATTRKRSAIANSTIFSRCSRRARARMRHRLVCSNLIDLRGRPLPFRASSTSNGAGRRLWNVRVFGLLVVQYPSRHSLGTPLWLALSRSGRRRARDRERNAARHDADRALASRAAADRGWREAVPRLDLILGGHSHDRLPRRHTSETVPIVHAGPFGAFVSRTELRARRRTDAHSKASRCCRCWRVPDAPSSLREQRTR